MILTQPEQKLVHRYRYLNETGKDMLSLQVDLLSGNDKYRKS